MSGDVMVAWLQQLSGNEFEHTPGDSDGQEAWHDLATEPQWQ